jgi:hypothetical protein
VHGGTRVEHETNVSPPQLDGWVGEAADGLAKNGPKYLRWALIEAATHAARDAHYRERYERTKQRLGRQRGAKVARVDIARKLAEAIWHVLIRPQQADGARIVLDDVVCLPVPTPVSALDRCLTIGVYG